MDKVEKGVTTLMGWLLAILMGVMMVDIFAEVISRYVLRASFGFSEELGRYVFVWIVFIGMAGCVAKGKHVALDILPNALKGGAKRALMTAIYILQMLLFCALTIGGFALYEIGVKQKSATMRLPMNLIYICIPLCGLTSLFFLARRLYFLYRKGGKAT